MTVDVDTSKFTAMCKDISALCNTPPDQVLREEVGKVLERAIELTPAADVSKIKTHQQRALFSQQPVTLYAPKRPARRHLKNGKVLYRLIGHRYPDELWAKLTAARAADLKKRMGARGLAKQSWLRIGKLLGLSVQAPSYVERAVARSGKEYSADESVKVIRQATRLEYVIENSQPTINKIRGAEILKRAISGRVGYFMANVAHDVFKKMGDIAKKYPGVKVE